MVVVAVVTTLGGKMRTTPFGSVIAPAMSVYLITAVNLHNRYLALTKTSTSVVAQLYTTREVIEFGAGALRLYRDTHQ